MIMKTPLQSFAGAMFAARRAGGETTDAAETPGRCDPLEVVDSLPCSGVSKRPSELKAPLPASIR